MRRRMCLVGNGLGALEGGMVLKSTEVRVESESVDSLKGNSRNNSQFFP